MIHLFCRRKVYTLHIFETGIVAALKVPDTESSWHFHAKAANGEILFQSEGYTRKEDAERAAVALTKAKLVIA